MIIVQDACPQVRIMAAVHLAVLITATGVAEVVIVVHLPILVIQVAVHQTIGNSKIFNMLKKLFLLFLFSGSLDSFSQCDANAFVFNLTPGVTRSGAWLSMEAGIWPVQGKLGVTAGPVMYDEKINTAKGAERLTQIDVIGRVIYKLTATGSDRPQLITVFGTVRGLVGASYRAYWSIGESQLVGVEPVVVSRLGVGVNVLFTARL